MRASCEELSRDDLDSGTIVNELTISHLPALVSTDPDLDVNLDSEVRELKIMCRIAN
jgi:hypothetical protein